MLDKNKIKLFVYGTLMKDFRNYDKYLKGRVISFENATTKGELYHLIHKNCPAMIFGNNTVYGEVITFYDDEKFTLLNELDLMEEYFEGSKVLMYKRQEIKVRYGDSTEDKVFAYVFINKKLLNETNSIYLSHGDWTKYITQREV